MTKHPCQRSLDVTITRDYWRETCRLFIDNQDRFNGSPLAFLDHRLSGPLLCIRHLSSFRRELSSYRNDPSGVGISKGKYCTISDELIRLLLDKKKRAQLVDDRGRARRDKLKAAAVTIALGMSMKKTSIRIEWIDRFIANNPNLFSTPVTCVPPPSHPVFDLLAVGEEEYVLLKMNSDRTGHEVPQEKKFAFYTQQFRLLKLVPAVFRRHYGRLVERMVKDTVYKAILIGPYDTRPGPGRRFIAQTIAKMVCLYALLIVVSNLLTCASQFPSH
jgi:hypothetical protein